MILFLVTLRTLSFLKVIYFNFFFLLKIDPETSFNREHLGYYKVSL